MVGKNLVFLLEETENNTIKQYKQTNLRYSQRHWGYFKHVFGIIKSPIVNKIRMFMYF